MEEIKVAVVYGPTASGKSDFAVDWALKNNAEIISVDSVQIYRMMDVGTAKPDAAMRSAVKHHLVDILDPYETINARKFAELARATAIEIASRKKLPLFVGGSGLYFDAIFHDFFECPSSSQELRKKLNEEWLSDGGASSYARLLSIDPPLAQTVHRNNSQRVIRALEVFEITGRPFSSFANTRKRVEWLSIVFSRYANPPREELYKNINNRTIQMLKNGWIEETASIIARYGRDIKCLEAIGYREIAHLLSQNTERARSFVKIENEAICSDIQKKTRHYAKRQIVWFDKYNLSQ